MTVTALKTRAKASALSAHRKSADFDFLMGVWRVHHRYLVKRLAGCHDWIEFGGYVAARHILDGWGNMDEGPIELPGGHYRGTSLRLYDPATSKWAIYWLDSRCPGRLFPPVYGTFEDGPFGPVGTFLGDDAFKGRPIRVRFIWSRITPDSARWEQAFSLDEGNTWENNWFMDFTRE